MYLKYRFTAGFLMQSVDILGNYSLEFSFFLKLRKLDVRDIRFYAIKKDLFSVKTIKLFRIFHKKRVTDDFLGRIIILLIIQSVNTAEVRDTALGRHTGSTKEYYVVAAFNHLQKFLKFFFV